MKIRRESFCGVIDLLEDKSPELCRRTIDWRKKQQNNFSIVGAEISSQQEWQKWQKQVNSFWSREYITVPAAILTQKSINSGLVLGLPKKFRILLIPCFTDLPMELPYIELFSFIRIHGGLVCLIPPLNEWNSKVCGFNGIDLITCMVDGQNDMSTALYHLNHRQKVGFIGVNQVGGECHNTSYIWLHPQNYKLSEYDVFRCFKDGLYSLSNSNENFVRLEPVHTVYSAETSCSKLKLNVSLGKNGIPSELWKNGRAVNRKSLSSKPVSVSFSVKGKEYYFLKSKDGEFYSITAPLFVRSPNQLWGDHHVHYIFKDGLFGSRMDYIVYGLYGQVHKFEEFPGIVPGGEIHGATDRGKPDNLHFLIVQKKLEDHSYTWEPGEGNEETVLRAEKYGDFSILAHPSLEGKYLFKNNAAFPDGIEILHGFSILAPVINQNPRLRRKAEKVFGPEFASGLKNDSVKISTDLWDTKLSKGKRCLGVGDGDQHGPAFHGAFANNFGAGYPVTVINAKKAAVFNVQKYLYEGDVWCTDTGFTHLSMKVNNKRMGLTSTLQKQNQISIAAESCFPIEKIRLISQGKTVREIKGDDHDIRAKCILPKTVLKNYLRAELIDGEGNRAFSNPVYF